MTTTINPRRRLITLSLMCIGFIAVYILWRLPIASTYLIHRRILTVATLIVVAIAIGVATVLFHTVTTNHILTPSIMGLDALYIALQTASVFHFGIHRSPTPIMQFSLVLACMVGMSLLLFHQLLVRLGRSIHLMILVGVLLGGLLRGVSSFLQRLLDPQAFQVLQDRFFANFSGANPRLLALSAVLVGASCTAVWVRRRELDVLALGPELATNLGLHHRRSRLRILILVSALVGTATALVGPTLFFGLLAAHAAYRLLGTHRHTYTLPGVAFAGIIALVGGQWFFERVLGFEGSLSMVVEFVGGSLFLFLLLKDKR